MRGWNRVPGCRLRTYGIKYRDYLPYYYLGVAQQAQGRWAEARESFARSLAEGVIESCPSSKVQSYDLRLRLAELEDRSPLVGRVEREEPDLSTVHGSGHSPCSSQPV